MRPMGKILIRIVWAVGALLLLVVAAGGIAWLRFHPSPPGIQVWTHGHVLTMDADGQHLSESLPSLLGPIIRKEADVTIGACTRRG